MGERSDKFWSKLAKEGLLIIFRVWGSYHHQWQFSLACVHLFVLYSVLHLLWLTFCNCNQRLMVLPPLLRLPRILALLSSQFLLLALLFSLLSSLLLPLHNFHILHLMPFALLQYPSRLLLRLSFLDLIFLCLKLILLPQLGSSTFFSIRQVFN